MRIAALDLGSNSFHLLVVDAHPDGTFDTLITDKEVLHLGEVVARDGRLGAADVTRAVETVRRFGTIARGAGACEIHACATSALREADNSAEVVDEIERETGITVRVIGGGEEARLIFEAVRASVRIDRPPAVVVDLGGGSLEVAVGDARGMRQSWSLKLGAARLTAQLVHNDPPTAGELRRVAERAEAVLENVAGEVASFDPAMMVGTSGTFCDIARIAEATRSGSVPVSINQTFTARREVEDLRARAAGMTAAERRRLPGLDARRAEQLPAGIVVLLTAMRMFRLDGFTAGAWALREGIVIDAVGHHDLADWSADAEAMRRSSVVGLARRCGWDEQHASTVARLAMGLFDGLAPVHRLSPVDRELLEYGALLHDIGEHIAVESHHKHTAYLIEHGRLRGFAPDEVAALATLGRFHRRSDPKASFEPWASLGTVRRGAVLKMLALLRLADGLDRGHSGQIDRVEVDLAPDRARLILFTQGDADLEVWGARRKRDLFERVFERRVELVAADHPSLGRRHR